MSELSRGIAIKNIENRTILSITDKFIGEDEAKYIVQALNDNEVTILSLWNSNMNFNFRRNINFNVFTYLADNLKTSQITRLSLCNCNLNDKGVNYLAKILKDTKITELNLTGNWGSSRNLITYKGALCLNKILNTTKIETLNLEIGCSKSHPPISNRSYQHVCVHQISSGKTKMSHRLIIEDCEIGIDGFHYFNESFETKEISELIIRTPIRESSAKYFAEALKDVVIQRLDASDSDFWRSGEYMAQAFKGAYITFLYLDGLGHNPIFNYHLVTLVEELNILILDLSWCQIESYPGGMIHLAPAIQRSNLMQIRLSSNQIDCHGIKHLSKVLRDTKIRHLDVGSNYILNSGLKTLADGLIGSQVTYMRLDDYFDEDPDIKPLSDIIENTNLSRVDYPYETAIVRKTTSVADKLRDIFKTTVSLNPVHNEFEFVLPGNCTGLEQYVFLMKTLLKDSINAKVHIIDMMCMYEDDKNGDYTFDYDTMKKIDKFIPVMPQKFITFFNNGLPDLIEMLGTDIDEYLKLVKQFHEAGFYDIVKNLLLHRILYYVDENQEILHPYIYKLLCKYNMPLYNEQIEPNKREKIIAYYQDHLEIDGAQDIIEFLRSE